MKTYMAKESTLRNNWCLVDANHEIVGRLAAKIARILMGKHKATYTPHLDNGDFVVVLNVESLRFTGKKLEDKVYRRYTGYLSGLRERKAADLMAKEPAKVLWLAVKRMMPKTKLGRKMLGKLKIYTGPEHPHSAQEPQKIDLAKILGR